MLPQAAERITSSLRSDALVLQVSGGRDVLERVDWVLDDGPYEPHGGARYTRASWVERDVCGREPWPFPAAHFDFAICTRRCVTTWLSTMAASSV